MAAFVLGRPRPAVSRSLLEAAARRVSAPRGGGPDGARRLYELQRDLRDIMWDRAGLVRDARGLDQALVEIEGIESALRRVTVPGGGRFNLAWQDWLNLESQATVARLIVLSAAERRESRGAHYRSDFPLPEGGPLYTVRAARSADGPLVSRAPVRLTRASPDAAAPTPAMIEIGD
jgi:succinate dehydrogenase/fumarate reductase flavoprotein subunit